MLINTIVFHGEVSYLPHLFYKMVLIAVVFFALFRFCNLGTAILVALVHLPLQSLFLGERIDFHMIVRMYPDAVYIAIILAALYVTDGKKKSRAEDW